MSGHRIPTHPRATAAPIRFRFDGRELIGREGDTLAAALLANGVRLVGRSFKYHRPRGIMGHGFAEPNTLVRVGDTPNLPATLVPLTPGLEAVSQNRWPTLAFDIGALNGLFGPLLSAGFYYKSFIWPRWELFEPFIRRAAGLGRAPDAPDEARYASDTLSTEVLVVGAGVAGTAAALAAANAGVKVLLIDSGAIAPPDHPDIRTLGRTTALGYHDHNLLTLIEEVGASGVRQRLWKVRAGRVVLATGAFERPLLFHDNDRPGVMLAGSVRHYLETHGVAPGRRAVFAVADDDGLAVAQLAAEAGIQIAALLDLRRGERIHRAIGRSTVRAAEIELADGRNQRIACDLIAMSGGRSPAVQLLTQSGGKLRHEPGLGAFVPDQPARDVRSCGAARGIFDEEQARADGAAAGLWAATGTEPPAALYPTEPAPVPPLPPAGDKAFIDFQTDATTSDFRQAVAENYRSPEHVKRYTVWGMGVDQGKLGAANGVAALAALQGIEPGAVGTTKFRPPFAPLAFGALAAGHGIGRQFRRWRRLPAHHWHAAMGAVFEDYGWLRPTHYPLGAETIEQAAQREALAVRTACGLLDSSSYGKIELQGPQAAEFLDRIALDPISDMPVGTIRHSLFLDELATPLDDVGIARLADDHFLLTISSDANDHLLDWLERWHQCEWPLDLLIHDATAQWAVFTLTGPNARAVLAASDCDIPLSAEDFPHAAIRTGRLSGEPVRIQRISFTGEASYEVAVAADAAESLAAHLMACGRPYGLIPFGIDALDLLRIEKGHFHAGVDTDSRTRPADIGWSGNPAAKPQDYLGKRTLLHPAASRRNAAHLISLHPLDPGITLPIGAHIIGGSSHPSQGIVTSSGFSPMLNRGLSLALLENGHHRTGETVEIWSEGQTWKAQVAPRCSFDRNGERLNV